MKNQERPCLELSTRINAQQTGDDHMAMKVVEEWRETILSHCGHCNFSEIVQQYLHNLEQGYVMYGLIAQKNNEIDKLEDEIGDLEQSLEHHRSKSHQPSDKNYEGTISSTSRSPRKQEQEFAIASQFMAKFQSILSSMELQITLNEQGNPLFFDFPKVIEQCHLACSLLIERTAHLVASVTSTDSSSNKQRQWEYPNIPPLATSRSSNSSNSYIEGPDESPSLPKGISN